MFQQEHGWYITWTNHHLKQAVPWRETAALCQSTWGEKEFWNAKVTSKFSCVHKKSTNWKVKALQPQHKQRMMRLHISAYKCSATLFCTFSFFLFLFSFGGEGGLQKLDRYLATKVWASIWCTPTIGSWNSPAISRAFRTPTTFRLEGKEKLKYLPKTTMSSVIVHLEKLCLSKNQEFKTNKPNYVLSFLILEAHDWEQALYSCCCCDANT